MSTVFDLEHLVALSPAREEAARWTAIIPAAGRGTRLGSADPKLLFPLLGRPMLDWIVDLVAPFCANIVVVASPEGEKAIGERLTSLIGPRGAVVVQPAPIGMAEAVSRGLARVTSDNTLVIWGDQVTARVDTLARCIRLHLESGAKLTMPTFRRPDPYIDFERHPDGRLKSVYHRRESDLSRDEGENDCGLFLFQSDALRALLADGLTRPEAVGQKTGELNFLGLFPILDIIPGDVASVRITDGDETLGVNTVDDARRVESVLSSRRRLS